MTVNGRVLQCTQCDQNVWVLEASTEAATDADHEWIDPAHYRCGTCQEEDGEAVPATAGAVFVQTAIAQVIEKAKHAQATH